VIKKVRIKKKYRHPELDKKIRERRTIIEGKMLNDARMCGVPTPILLNIDLNEMTLIYEYIEGVKIKKILNELNEAERRKVNFKIGQLIGLLHFNGLIHGDLTTSNMIITRQKIIYFIDFGLCEYSTKIEKKAVDLHLLKRALESTHYKIADQCFNEIFVGYKSVLGKEAELVHQRMREIAKRGRYVSER
ncbi:MAG: KEOPS complex kinase/ATPase Bud32, partial [Candidatus Odinarchaeia archaeon]